MEIISWLVIIKKAKCFGKESNVVAKIGCHFILVEVTLGIIQPRKIEYHVEEINLPSIQSHDIIVTSNNVGVEVVQCHSFDYLSSIGEKGEGVNPLID